MTFLATLIVFGIAIAGMAIGLMISGKVLKKGCSLTPEDEECSVCGKKAGEPCQDDRAE